MKLLFLILFIPSFCFAGGKPLNDKTADQITRQYNSARKAMALCIDDGITESDICRKAEQRELELQLPQAQAEEYRSEQAHKSDMKTIESLLEDSQK